MQQLYQRLKILWFNILPNNHLREIARYRTPNARFRTLPFQKLYLSLHMSGNAPEPVMSI